MQALEQFVAAGLLTAEAPPPPDDDGVASGAAAGAMSGGCALETLRGALRGYVARCETLLAADERAAAVGEEEEDGGDAGGSGACAELMGTAQALEAQLMSLQPDDAP